MTTAIVAMQSGEKPVEPGWYVACSNLDGDKRMLVSVGPWDGHLVVQVVGLERLNNLANFTLIARIYPERIEA